MIRRSLLWCSLTLIALLIVLALLTAWGLGTRSGTSALWSIASRYVPGLEAASIEGHLAGPLKISGLRYTDTYRAVSIDSIELDWRPQRLLAAEVQVEELLISGIQFTQLSAAATPEATAEFSLPQNFELLIDIILNRLIISDFIYKSSGEAAAITIDHGELIGQLRAQALSIKKLSVRGPLFSIEGSSDTQTQGAYASQTRLEWELWPAQFAPASGTLQLRGNLDKLRIEHSVNAPYSLTQTVDVQDPTGALRFDSNTRLDAVQMSQLNEAFPDALVGGTLAAKGTLRDLSFDARLGGESPIYGTLALELQGTFQNQLLTLSQMLLRDTGALALRASGEVDLGASVPSFEAQSEWQSLRWPLTGPPRIVGKAGTGRIRGTLADYALSVQSQLDVPEQAGGVLTVNGRGDSESFELNTLRIALLDGELGGTGRVRWIPDISGFIALSGNGIDPSVLVEDLPGKLQLEVRASASDTSEGLSAQIDTLVVNGTLRELPINLQLDGRLDRGSFDIGTLALRAGATQLSANGTAGEMLNVDWSLNSPDLGDLLPGASGTLRGEGHLGGDRTLPTLQASLHGADLAYSLYALKTLSLQADVDLSSPEPSSINLALAEGTLGDATLQDLTLNGTGTRESHTLSLASNSSLGSVDLGLEGNWTESSWIARLTQGQLRYGALEEWVLREPHALSAGVDAQTIDKGCWSSDAARLCFSGKRIDAAVSGEARLENLQLAYLKPLMPPGIRLEGTASGAATLLSSDNRSPDIKAQLELVDTAVYSTEAASRQGTGQLIVALQASSVSVVNSAEGLRAQLQLPFANTGGLSAEIRVDSGDAALTARPLQGSIDIDLPDITLLSSLSPELERAAGALRGELALSGSLAAPQSEGQLRLSDGELQLDTPGLEVSDITLDAYSSGAQNIRFEGSAVSGGGQLAVRGELRLTEAGTEGEVAVTGDAFQLLDTRDARVFVSPRLDIALNQTGTRITGEVLVPQADITPRQLPASAVSVSSDQVIVRDQNDDPVRRVSKGNDTRVRITLGEDVKVDGFGFKGQLNGSVLVQQTSNRPTIGTGDLNIIDGEYRAYGQGLVIDEGKLLFAGGPVTQPGIRVRAVRRPATDILVGVRVAGPLQEPEFALFSEPAMGQTEQLSWLVLGRALEGSSDGQEDMLAQAATALGLRGGNYLAERFGDELGVDSIGFEAGSGEAGAASDVNQAAFVIGKYLSPDLFVSYGIGLFDSISTIRLEYIISRHWTVSSESSTIASGADVTYTVEQ